MAHKSTHDILQKVSKTKENVKLLSKTTCIVHILAISGTCRRHMLDSRSTVHYNQQSSLAYFEFTQAVAVKVLEDNEPHIS